MRSEYRRKDEIEAEYYSTELPTIYTKWNPNPKPKYIPSTCMKQ